MTLNNVPIYNIYYHCVFVGPFFLWIQNKRLGSLVDLDGRGIRVVAAVAGP